MPKNFKYLHLAPRLEIDDGFVCRVTDFYKFLIKKAQSFNFMTEEISLFLTLGETFLLTCTWYLSMSSLPA